MSPATPRLIGPSLGPANGEAPKKLVVLVHGLGADGNDLIGLAPYFAQVLPDAEFLAPDGPEPCDMAPFGRQWFSLRDFGPETRQTGVRKAGPVLDAYLSEELARRGLADGDLALVGFSQGSMMSLHVGLRRSPGPAGILAYSGMLVGADWLADEKKSSPPVRLIHGEADEVLLFPAMAAAERGLRAADVPVDSFARPGLGHGIDEEGIRLGQEFLRQVFAKG